MKVLVIGGIEIPQKSAHQLTQNYSPVQSVSRIRMGDGTLTQQSAWAGKTSTEISADGLIPAGINEIDYSQPVTIKCIAERVITSASNIIDIPIGRRADYGVEGRALLDGLWQTTPVSMSVDQATLTIVVGATQYQAIYWPELSCYLDPPNETRDTRTSAYGWTITAEEI